MLIPAAIVIIITIITIIVVLLLTFMYSEYITSNYSFFVSKNINTIKEVLEDTNNYPEWWNKISKFYIYKIKSKVFNDSKGNTIRFIIYIKSPSSKEMWNIILKKRKRGTRIFISQDLKLRSKFSKIISSTLKYRKDLLGFKNSLIRKLKDI